MKGGVARQLEELATMMECISEVFGSRIEAHQVRLFCLAAAADIQDNPLNSRALADKMELSTSAVSRNLAWFSDRGRQKKPGLRMIEAKPDVNDYRRKPLMLTAAGKRAANRLAKLVATG